METLNGTVERITYINGENGFSVIKIKCRDFEGLATLVGTLGSVNIGAVIRAHGFWKYDSKFGKQFIVQNYSEIMPSTVEGIKKYLGSGLIKGIRAVNAGRIVQKFKGDTIRIIEEEPEKLLLVEGIGEKKLEMIKIAWAEQKEIKNVMLFLQSHGVSTTYAVKIYKTYGNDSINVVKQNPFRLADDIWGIGFRTADKIAQALGYDKNSYPRCKAGIIYVLNECSNEGHCFATTSQLVEKAKKILDIDEDLIRSSINKMLNEKSIIPEINDALYLPSFYHSEIGVAKRVKEILCKESPYASVDVENIIQNIQKKNKINYDTVQIDAIQTAVTSKFMVLTGGPGTGKTTITLAIIKIFEQLKAEILLAAPTGRAAKRMTEAAGRQSSTIHRLLEFRPGQGYTKNSENMLKCDVLIIDEFSMVDLSLMYNLLKAVPDHAIVVLIGDIDQLPSVGAGNVLKDIIMSGAIRVARLNKIFRQSLDSLIITNAHRINRGLFPVLKGENTNDFFFIEESDAEKAVELIKDLCSKRLPKFYGVDPIDGIQVLSPMLRGELGVGNINLVLQQTLNASKISIKHRGINYRTNDKVMQIKNNYDKGVFNGDIGKIIFIEPEEKYAIVNFDGTDVEYDITEMDQITLAYATTIHKSQGSEYDIVIAPFTLQHYIMLQRNLLYTCITRAKKAMILVGTKKALMLAIRNNKSISRNTMLKERLALSNI